MRRLYTTLTMVALLVLSAVSLTSCDDEAIAYTLEGTWEGRTQMAFTYDNRTWESTYSYINSTPTPSNTHRARATGWTTSAAMPRGNMWPTTSAGRCATR